MLLPQDRIDLLIIAGEGVMDCDATCLVMGSTSPLLNLIGFLIFAAVALCVTGDSGGGHRQPRFWAGIARLALTRAA